MRIRWIALVSFIVFLAAAVIGVVERRTYTDIALEENPIEHFQVGVFDDGLISILSREEYEELVREESGYIVKLRAVSDLQFEFYYMSRMFEVLEVYEGENLSKGEVITIGLGPLFLSEEPWAANIGFVNKMEKGKDYLIYLGRECEIPNSENRVFMVAEVSIPPIFPYECGSSTPTEEMGITDLEVDYTKVEDSAYFAKTQEGLDALLTYREHMMEGYN